MKMKLDSNLPDDLETLVRNVIGAAFNKRISSEPMKTTKRTKDFVYENEA
ncbi:MAG: hypothetical protein ACLFVO_29485 [Chloroflexaceae bacterium]|jgi:hypothetical protein